MYILVSEKCSVPDNGMPRTLVFADRQEISVLNERWSGLAEQYRHRELVSHLGLENGGQ